MDEVEVSAGAKEFRRGAGDVLEGTEQFMARDGTGIQVLQQIL